MKKLVIFLLAFLLIVSIGYTQNSLLVATVNIEDPFVTTNKNTYSVEFKLTNRAGIQSDIRYGIELITEQDSIVVDRELQNQALTLKEGAVKDIKVEYTLPNYIKSGNYKLAIVVKNSTGIPFAYFPLESVVSVDNTKTILEITSCELMNKEMRIGDVLNISCKISGTSVDDYNNIGYSIHKNDIFGDLVAEDTQKNLKISADNTIEFTVPIESSFGTYVIDIYLEKNNYKTSTSYPLSYNIEGKKLTIHNTILDKTSYMKGDLANLQIFWLSPEKGENILLTGEIKNKSNQVCGKFQSQASSQTSGLSEDSLKINIEEECENAIAFINITDTEGNLLDKASINTFESTQKVLISPNVKKKPLMDVGFWTARNIVIIGIIIILIVILGLVLKMRKNKSGNLK